jgi:hypothetical protein
MPSRNAPRRSEMAPGVPDRHPAMCSARRTARYPSWALLRPPATEMKSPASSVPSRHDPPAANANVLPAIRRGSVFERHKIAFDNLVARVADHATAERSPWADDFLARACDHHVQGSLLHAVSVLHQTESPPRGRDARWGALPGWGGRPVGDARTPAVSRCRFSRRAAC